jgi:hypothetical protein
MAAARHHLQVVAPARATERPADRCTDEELEDLAFTAAIFAISILPLAAEVTHAGHWGNTAMGFGTLGALFAGRALWTRAVQAFRAGRRP